MPGTVEHLVPAPGALAEGEHEVFGSEHPIRVVTRAVAFGGGWASEQRDGIAGFFDRVADVWTADHEGDDRYASLDDALARGAVEGRRCLELGSGTGLGTARLSGRFDVVVALDLSSGMLRNAPAELGHRVRGDSASLPVRSAAADVLVLVNMLLFPREVDRVLAPGGALVWVNTYAEETPIHLPAADVVAALPGEWGARASRAGTGTWCVARRT